MVPCVREPRRPPWLSGTRRESPSESESLRRVSLRTRTSGPGLARPGQTRTEPEDRDRDQNSVFFHTQYSILNTPSYRRRSIPAGTRRGDAGGTGGVQWHDRGGGTGESAGLTKMAATMERFVSVVKQYPGQQQVDLAVEIEVPGSWFCAGPMGSLTATDSTRSTRHRQSSTPKSTSFQALPRGHARQGRRPSASSASRTQRRSRTQRVIG